MNWQLPGQLKESELRAIVISVPDNKSETALTSVTSIVSYNWCFFLALHEEVSLNLDGIFLINKA